MCGVAQVKVEMARILAAAQRADQHMRDHHAAAGQGTPAGGTPPLGGSGGRDQGSATLCCTVS